jgi:hypothetical protein
MILLLFLAIAAILMLYAEHTDNPQLETGLTAMAVSVFALGFILML